MTTDFLEIVTKQQNVVFDRDIYVNGVEYK
jgi:hypothetical protein